MIFKTDEKIELVDTRELIQRTFDNCKLIKLQHRVNHESWFVAQDAVFISLRRYKFDKRD